MRRSRWIVTAALVAAASLAPPALADTKVTDQAYVRHDGGTDATIADCSVNNRQQNEPTVAVDPADPTRVTAGANDYCTVPTTTDAWAGFYWSTDGGDSWTNSLLPGYPTDTSAEGQASPLYGLVTSAGDPVQDWDRNGNLYYGGIAFNRAKPANASIWVARYSWAAPQTAPDHQYTTIVSQGTPTPLFIGQFEDKVELEVDDGVDSPYAGRIYVCWARFVTSGANNFIELAVSDDQGRTWKRQKLSESIHGNQGCDIAVTRDGTVFVTWRQFDFKPDQGQKQRDAIAWVKSTDGGKSFTKPAVAHEFVHWDMGDVTVSFPAAAQTRYEACLAADLGPGACSQPDRNPPLQAPARDCGDGPLACQSGYVFGRVDSGPRNAADPSAEGDPDALYVVIEATVPGTETDSETTYGTVEPGVASQGSIYFTMTPDGGATWTPLERVDEQDVGNQFYPDVDASEGALHVMWQDTRSSTATGPDGTFVTVPFENQWTAANPPGATSSGPGAETFYETTSTAAPDWSTPATAVSAAPYKLNWEQFGNRDVPFFGDYNYVSAVGSTVVMTWTDGRDTVPGTDPRYPIDGVDGFDVFQTRACSGTPPVCGPDTTPNAGGLDQNIYGAALG